MRCIIFYTSVCTVCYIRANESDLFYIDSAVQVRVGDVHFRHPRSVLAHTLSGPVTDVIWTPHNVTVHLEYWKYMETGLA